MDISIRPSRIKLETEDWKLFQSLRNMGRELNNPMRLFGREWYLIRTEYFGNAEGAKCEMTWGEIVHVRGTSGDPV